MFICLKKGETISSLLKFPGDKVGDGSQRRDSDRPKTSTIFFRENRIQSLNKHASLVEHEFL